MRHVMTTKNDLRNWVDAATTGWERGAADVDTITDAIQATDHPAWGTDWTEYLDGLPELDTFLA